MDGIEFVRYLKEQNNDYKVIVMTGDVGRETLPDDVENNIIAQLLKPVSLLRLSAVIKEALC